VADGTPGTDAASGSGDDAAVAPEQA
jgi:hypothetical protein